MSKRSKYDRILSLNALLDAGELVNKAELAQEFGVDERTIQRDIQPIAV